MVHTIERTNPYNVEVTKIGTACGKRVYLAFGRAANTPFGTVSNIDKRRIGIAQGFRFAAEIKAIGSDEIAALRDRCWKEFLALGQEHTNLIEGEKPVQIFREKFAEACDRGEIHILPSAAAATKGNGTRRSGVVGWANGDYLYVPAGPTFAAVKKACNATGEPFPVSRFRLFKNLKMEGLTDCDPDRYTKMVSVHGRKRRMLVLRRDAFEG